MINHFVLAGIAGVALVAASGSAVARPVYAASSIVPAAMALSPGASFTLKVFQEGQGGTTNDKPRFQLFNTSSDLLITRLVIALGDTTFNFDQFDTVVRLVDSGATLNLTNRSPDSVNNAGRSDVLSSDFTGFDPGDVLGFRGELDTDVPPNSSVDFNTLLFSTTTPARVTVTFADLDGAITTLRGSFGGISPVNGVYEVVVPQPGTLALLGFGLAGVALRRRRRV